jgi:hypothetical protein
VKEKFQQFCNFVFFFSKSVTYKFLVVFIVADLPGQRLTRRLTHRLSPAHHRLTYLYIQTPVSSVPLYSQARWQVAQSRQSAKLFRQTSELGFAPHPLTRRRVCPLAFGSRGDTLARGRGDGGSQFGRGERHCGTIQTEEGKRYRYPLDR